MKIVLHEAKNEILQVCQYHGKCILIFHISCLLFKKTINMKYEKDVHIRVYLPVPASAQIRANLDESTE